MVRDSIQYTYETYKMDGTIDLNVEIWPQNNMGWYEEQIAKGTIAGLQLLLGSHNGYLLKELPYTNPCWNEVTSAVNDKSLRPFKSACAFADIPLGKGVFKTDAGYAPDVGVDPINRELAGAHKNDNRYWNMVAVHYIRNNEDQPKSGSGRPFN